MYSIPSTDTNPYFVGDMVKVVASADATYGIPGVTLATAGAPARGVIVAVGANPQGGPYIDPTNLTLVSIPATKTKAYFVLVCEDPTVIYEIQENTGGTALVASQMSKNANIIYTAPASGVNVSGTTLDNGVTTNPATTASLNLRILGVVQRQGNTPYVINQRVLVSINSHDLQSVGTLGT
jgi:hypothetical protein